VHRPLTDQDSARLALAALDKVSGPESEWMALWATTSQRTAVEQRLHELRAVLSG
jgi:hypothetical protein